MAAVAGAGAAWKAAITGGAQYAQNAPGVVLSVRGVGIPFFEKHFSVRLVDERFVLWDDDESKALR